MCCKYSAWGNQMELPGQNDTLAKSWRLTRGQMVGGGEV